MSPVLSAVTDTLAFMRINSTSKPSSRNMPRLSANPPVRKETSTAEIDIRTLSIASAVVVEIRNDKPMSTKRFIKILFAYASPLALHPFRLNPLRFYASFLRILAGDEILTAHRHRCLFFIFWCPCAQAVTVPWHSRCQFRQADLFPDLLGIFHELFLRQRDRWIGPGTRGVDQQRGCRQYAAHVGRNAGRIRRRIESWRLSMRDGDVFFRAHIETNSPVDHGGIPDIDVVIHGDADLRVAADT